MFVGGHSAVTLVECGFLSRTLLDVREATFLGATLRLISK